MASSAYAKYRPASSRLPTAQMWGDCPFDAILLGEVDGRAIWDDFYHFSAVNPTLTGSSGWTCVSDTGSTVQPAADNVNGALALVTDTTDEDEIYLVSGGNAGGCAIIDTTGGTKMWWETRIKVSSITNGDIGLFFGLARPPVPADFLVDATGVLISSASMGMLGLQILGADGDAINWVYRDGTGAVQTALAAAAVPVADTYIKFGMVFDPNAAASKRISLWINGVEQSTYITAANIAASTFPNGEEMSLAFCMKSLTAAAKTVSIDWVKFAQLSA